MDLVRKIRQDTVKIVKDGIKQRKVMKKRYTEGVRWYKAMIKKSGGDSFYQDMLEANIEYARRSKELIIKGYEKLHELTVA